jgi:hypothetical protein
MRQSVTIAVFFLAVAAQAGCADVRVVQPGLANVVALPLSDTIDVHDAVANGHDSCPRSRAAGDPLRARYPACTGGETASFNTTFLVAPAVRPGPADDLWNLHLRGLPPCEGDRAARSNERALAMCRAPDLTSH